MRTFGRAGILQMAADQERRRQEEEDRARRQRIARGHSDPLAAINAVDRAERQRELAGQLLGAHDHLTPAQAARLAGEYQSLPRDGWAVGSRQDRVSDAVSRMAHRSASPAKGAPSDPAGDRVRQLAADVQPFLPRSGAGFGAPNPQYGEAHGLVWNSERSRWEPRDANADLERSAIELQMELAREKLAMEREEMQRQAGLEERKVGLGADLRSWLAKKLGGAA